MERLVQVLPLRIVNGIDTNAFNNIHKASFTEALGRTVGWWSCVLINQ
jgi:hypothetical protein